MWMPQSIYSDFLLYQPSILFGKDAINGLSNFGGAKVAVIHGNSIKLGIKNKLQRVFYKKDLSIIEKSWDFEPDFQSIKYTLSKIQKFAPDLIIAIGGGSVIDGAKMCRLLYEFPYFDINTTRLNQLQFKTKFIAIPTTVGSGAEASSAAVYINHEYKRKQMIVNHNLQPSVVVFDPEYVSETPYRILIASVMDAMAHIIEGYVSNRDNKLANIHAEKALEIIITELSKDEYIDFLRLQYAGYLGGVVQNHCVVGAAHAIAHQLANHGFAHGEAVSLLINPVIKINLKYNVDYSGLCNCRMIDSVERLMLFIDNLLVKSEIVERKLELARILKEAIKDEMFIKNIMSDIGGKGNPIAITKEYIEEIVGEI